MKKHKKIRGQKRKVWKEIDDWILANKKIDLEYLSINQRDYVKVWVSPFCDEGLVNYHFSPPKGKTRQKIIDGLFEIYHARKEQLKTLNQPYYLKIWFFDVDVSQSQVVCAVGDFINFYDITFYKPKENNPFPFNHRNLNWEYRHSETHISSDDFLALEDCYDLQEYLETKKRVRKIVNHPKTRVFKDDVKTYYSLKNANVWLGGE